MYILYNFKVNVCAHNFFKLYFVDYAIIVVLFLIPFIPLCPAPAPPTSIPPP